MNQCNCQRYGISSIFTGIFLAGAVLLGGMTGCGSKKEKESKAPAPQQVKAVKSTALETGSDTAAPAPPPTSSAVATTSPQEAAQTAINSGGPATASEAAVLNILNGALRQYNDPYARPDADSTAPKKFYPPAKDLNDLVKAGFLKSLPVAPDGKKFVIDNANGVVVLQ